MAPMWAVPPTMYPVWDGEPAGREMGSVPAMERGKVRGMAEIGASKEWVRTCSAVIVRVVWIVVRTGARIAGRTAARIA